jgi:hypothetical protein
MKASAEGNNGGARSVLLYRACGIRSIASEGFLAETSRLKAAVKRIPGCHNPALVIAVAAFALLIVSFA